MASIIQKMGRLAITTFKRDPKLTPGSFKNNYDLLCDLLARITPADLMLDPDLLVDHGRFNPSRDRAPVTYMQIYEDFDLTICVFILKRGVRLPLHDHPGMVGLLKVVHGAVSVQSYSLKRESKHDSETTLSPLHDDQNTHTNTHTNAHRLIPATKHQTLTATADDPACRLNPGEHNIHEIHSLDGPAAFLDILSPPYGTDERLGLERDCHYYREVEGTRRVIGGGGGGGGGGEEVLLYRVETPTDFWCDQSEYRGPSVTVAEDNGV